MADKIVKTRRKNYEMKWFSRRYTYSLRISATEFFCLFEFLSAFMIQFFNL